MLQCPSFPSVEDFFCSKSQRVELKIRNIVLQAFAIHTPVAKGITIVSYKPVLAKTLASGEVHQSQPSCCLDGLDSQHRQELVKDMSWN